MFSYLFYEHIIKYISVHIVLFLAEENVWQEAVRTMYNLFKRQRNVTYICIHKRHFHPRCSQQFIISNQIKSLLLSHHHSTSALVSEILMSVLQTVQKNNRQFTYGQTVQKKQQTIYIWTDSAKKQQTIYIWTDSAKKLHWSIYSAPDSAKKTTTAIYIWTDSAKKQQQFTYGQYIFTDCTEDNVQNTHTYTQYA